MASPVGSDSPPSSSWPLFAAVFLAVCLWGWVFGFAQGNFWLKLSISTAGLMAFSLWLNRAELRKLFRTSWRIIGYGVVSAAALYIVFWVGGNVLRAFFPASGGMIETIYATKSSLPSWAIAFLLIVLIGPAEEIFWRGLVQKRLVATAGPIFGLLLASTMYAVVHLWARNPVLVPAAFVCGLVWGWQYQEQSTLTGVIASHVLWDVAVFIVIPLH